MCGITGWLDFRRDLREDIPTLEQMTASLASRGPDGSGMWTAPHVALGHRRLAVVDLEGGAQPMVAQRTPDGEPVVLVYNGEIYNTPELRAQLIARGHLFTTRCDTEVVLRAYMEWGADCAEHLNGIFAFAVWDGDRETLTLVRDRLGVKPLYVHTYPGGLLFGSEPKAILANPLYNPVLEAERLPMVFNPRLKEPGGSVLTGLYEVAPASTLIADRSGAHEFPYWRLVSRPHTDDWDTTVATVRGLLEDIVLRQLVADVPVCSLLSGGLDSTALSALAAQLSGRPLTTFAVDFTESDRHFHSTVLRPDRDAPYAREASSHLGTQHTEVVLDSSAVAAGAAEALRARDLPSLGQFDASMLRLFAAVRRSSTVALSGEGADEVFGGYPWFHTTELVGADTYPWLGEGPRLAECLAPEVLDRVRPEEQERDGYATLLARVPRLEGESGLQARMREVLYLSLQGPLHLLLDRTDRMSMAVGLEARVPFCDHRLVEYLWNVPWSMKCADGREKSLLRAAVHDLLPPSLLNRRKSAYPATHAPDYTQQIITGVLRLLDDPDSPLRELLDADRVRKFAEGANVSVAWANTAHLLTPLLETDAWLRAYNVQIV
ncbi:asparagine synthase (glutamine-hydrolyzing) [Streptomyces misionensis]|uniref:asparagine synthase (glutamine-hydrolyzing) n=1 Tax=Streptomyces misionensis TaxID=67331 RepID=UPI0033E0D74E